MRKLILGTLFTFVCTTSLLSQITMGSASSPNSGAILDLKEWNGTSTNNNSTTTKGLGLPRIDLDNTTGPLTNLGLGEIGMIVYNISPNFGEGVGLYVWDGVSWICLNPSTGGSERIGYYTDQDGNPFTASRFGDAGIWMNTNLRARTFAPVNDEDENDGVLKLSGEHSTTEALYCYPYHVTDIVSQAGKEENLLDPSDFNSNTDIGLLYNYSAASKFKNIGLPDGYSDGMSKYDGKPIPDKNIEKVGVQGICPNGWHLPSDYEWNKLEVELAKSPSLSSTTKAPTPWNIDVISGTEAFLDYNLFEGFRPNYERVDDRPGHGATMKLGDLLINSPYAKDTNAKSLPATKGGFALQLCGIAFSINGKLLHAGYGDMAEYFTSSIESSFINPILSTEETIAWLRRLERTNSAVYRRAKVTSATHRSVRCKKDNNSFSESKL